MKRVVQHLPIVISCLALGIALVGVGPTLAKRAGLISGKQIKNNSIKAKKVKFPRAQRVRPGGARAAKVIAHTSVGEQYQAVSVMGTYDKADATSTLQITWTGPAQSYAPGGCVFQLRVDGQPPSEGGSEYFIAGGNANITTQALFPGIATGTHEIEVFAKSVNSGGADYPCVVGPPEVPIPQTVNAVELVQ